MSPSVANVSDILSDSLFLAKNSVGEIETSEPQSAYLVLHTEHMNASKRESFTRYI